MFCAGGVGTQLKYTLEGYTSRKSLRTTDHNARPMFIGRVRHFRVGAYFQVRHEVQSSSLEHEAFVANTFSMVCFDCAQLYAHSLDKTNC